MKNYAYYLLILANLLGGCNKKSAPADVITEPPAKAEPLLTSRPNRAKVNAKGKYITFPGVTTVADLAPEDHVFFEKLHTKLSKIPELTKYYALLPAKSYHMTTNNLFVKSSHKKDWNEFITNKLDWFKQFHKALQGKNISPQTSLREIKVERVMAIILSLSSEQSEEIHTFGRDFGVEDLVPKQFHITLAYLYQDIPIKTKKEIKRKVDVIFNELQAKHGYHNKKITLSAASLRYFDSMLEFIPWDGEANPFDL